MVIIYYVKILQLTSIGLSYDIIFLSFKFNNK